MAYNNVIHVNHVYTIMSSTQRSSRGPQASWRVDPKRHQKYLSENHFTIGKQLHVFMFIIYNFIHNCQHLYLPQNEINCIPMP